jgi:1-acyl-sn-glycerol-3-phosphate acyltransferase
MRQLDFPELSQNNPTHTREDSVTSRVEPWLARLVYPLGRYLVLPRYFGKLEVKGLEHLPEEGAAILAPTHRSRWDALLVPYVATARRDRFGRDLRFMVTVDEMKGVQGWFIRHLGGFPVNPRHAEISSLRHGVEVLEENKALVIFPEGDIFRTEEVQPIKAGLARLAIQAEANQPGLGIQIVPISIHYSEPIPHWGCDVEIRIGSPLQVADYCKKPVKQCAQHLKDDLKASLEDLREGR